VIHSATAAKIQATHARHCLTAAKIEPLGQDSGERRDLWRPVAAHTHAMALATLFTRRHGYCINTDTSADSLCGWLPAVAQRRAANVPAHSVIKTCPKGQNWTFGSMATGIFSFLTNQLTKNPQLRQETPKSLQTSPTLAANPSKSNREKQLNALLSPVPCPPLPVEAPQAFP
jgi:hypothetical protein